MAFNNWPYTNFQDLNLGWILSTYKTALNKALEALGKANAVEATVGTYTDSINAATLTANQASATANQAMNIARNANEVLFISADAENKAVNYVTWSQGGTGYVTASDIYSAIVTDHKVPVFMDRSQYIYEMAGYETDPNSPLTITRFKFQKDGGNRQDILWIDGTGSITYTTVYRGAGTFVVNITNSQSTGSITSDKTYSEISSAYNSGMSVQCHVVDEVRNLEYYACDCFFAENSETGDYFGWVSPYDYSNTRFYRAFVREDNLVGISVLPISGGGGGISIQDVIDTVNDGDTNALLSTAQTLSAAQKAQVKQNIGISDSGGSYSPYLIPVTMSGGVYSTTATGVNVFDHILDCRIEFNSVYYYPIGADTSGPFGNAYFASIDPSRSGQYDVEIFDIKLNGTAVCTVTRYEKDVELLFAPPIVDTATGDPASITDGANHYPLKSLIANIDPVQSGSGDPSPTNVRPITGWTAIRITKAITGDSGYWDVTLPSEAGIVYGGTLDVVNGVLTVDKAIVDMGNALWFKGAAQTSGGATVFSCSLQNIGAGVAPRERGSANLLWSDVYATCGDNMWFVSDMPDFTMFQNNMSVFIADSRYTDDASFRAAATGHQLVYKLANPITYQIDPIALYTALGHNGFSADSGAVTVEYYADTKLYIQKLVTTNANNRTSVTEVKEKPEIVLKETESEEKSEETPDEEIAEETEP